MYGKNLVYICWFFACLGSCIERNSLIKNLFHAVWVRSDSSSFTSMVGKHMTLTWLPSFCIPCPQCLDYRGIYHPSWPISTLSGLHWNSQKKRHSFLLKSQICHLIKRAFWGEGRIERLSWKMKGEKVTKKEHETLKEDETVLHLNLLSPAPSCSIKLLSSTASAFCFCLS